MKKQQMYSIGRFAKMTDVSIKQLRYLEDKGLLTPTFRDGNNNYRYYSHGQMRKLVFIKTLRELGMPFEDIVTILQSGEFSVYIGALQKHMGRVNRQVNELLENYWRSTAYLEQIYQGQNLISTIKLRKKDTDYEIELVEMPVQKIFSTRYRTNVASQDLFLDRLFELKKLGRERNLVFTDGLHAIFHDGYARQFKDLDGDLETFFPLLEEPASEKSVRQYGGFQGVSCLFLGHYKHMKECYQAMEAWAAERELELMDVSIEKYLVGPDIVMDTEQFVTQIVIPLKGSTL